MRTGLLLAWLLLSVPAKAELLEAGTPSEIAVQKAHEMAAAMSRLDVEALLRFIPETDAVVYVSKGFPIRGNDYRKEIGDSYASLKSLQFKWKRWETTPLSETIVIFTGWAETVEESLAGERTTESVVFTTVWQREPTGWKRVIAHKSLESD